MTHTLTGYVEHITFQNSENGYTVAKVRIDGDTKPTVVVGVMPALQIGETLNCQGEWKQHPVHGPQFVVSACSVEQPTDLGGIEKYLASGLIMGIGPVYARRIVETFGEQTLAVLDENPYRLREVSGIGKKRSEEIIVSWKEQRAIRQVMIFLSEIGLGTALAQRIYKSYGEQSIAHIKRNPYALSTEVWGVGFKTADQIAISLKIPLESPIRLKAGLTYVIQESAEQGHVCIPKQALIERASELLSQPEPHIESALQEELDRGYLITEKLEGRDFVWGRSLHAAEEGIIAALKDLMKVSMDTQDIEIGESIRWVQSELSIQLASRQRQAIQAAIQQKGVVITGGPGTGKSTIIHSILAIMGQKTDKIKLCAPTGRAAKRMTEITGYPATTIHSLLSFDFKKQGFRFDADNPLMVDVLIVDEVSMIDTTLMYHLLSALPQTARVVFVGDVFQLPSVGPGTVLGDMIKTGILPVVELKDIFRQAAGSKIILNAHAIHQGRVPDVRNDAQGDFFFLNQDDPEAITQTILGLVSERLPKKYGFNPKKEIQVITPQNKGPLGTLQLNEVLQSVLNPAMEGLEIRGKRYAVGDKVMQLRNNYTKEVFNGDMGYIVEIDKESQSVTVQIDEEEIEYEFSEMDELNLAYAVTVHKYQGSECPCVVMPLHTTHFRLLERNLFYTAVTRAKQLLVIVGSEKALKLAVSKNDAGRRFTGLGYRR